MCEGERRSPVDYIFTLYLVDSIVLMDGAFNVSYWPWHEDYSVYCVDDIKSGVP